jgi:hypothetical protein
MYSLWRRVASQGALDFNNGDLRKKMMGIVF